MNAQQKKEPKQPLKIDLDFKETLADMLKIKPPPERKPEAVKASEKSKGWQKPSAKKAKK